MVADEVLSNHHSSPARVDKPTSGRRLQEVVSEEVRALSNKQAEGWKHRFVGM
jgi:hypothetical protein